MSNTDWLNRELVELVRYVEVYGKDEDISQADREGINTAHKAITDKILDLQAESYKKGFIDGQIELFNKDERLGLK